MRAAAVALAGIAIAGCAAPWATLSSAFDRLEQSGGSAGSDWPYRPDRRDYIAFREAHPGILEPNYLPFMLHRFAGGGPEGDVLVLCRWDGGQMPIEVFVEQPVIPEALQHDVHPTRASAFATAVEGALREWERELEGLVRFRLVDDATTAALQVRLLGERAPTPRPDVVILGATEALLVACRPDGWDPDANRLQVRFGVPELVIYVADEYGLLTTGQVERVALHEIGHALGMLGHSPMPGDMMFAAYRERSEVRTLSEADVNSFVSLYRLPNGAHYGYVAPGAAAPRLAPLPPSGAPMLRAAPQVDAVRGYALRLPQGWLWAETSRGLFAANGPIWDYDASLELAVWPYADVESFLDRYADALFAQTWLRRREPSVVAHRTALRVLVEDADALRLVDFRFLALGDGRLLMIVAQFPLEAEAAWAPWLEASIASLELSLESGAPGWR